MSKSRDIADSAETINYIDTVTSNVQDQIDNLDPLPSQTGNAGNFLTTDGTNASWGVPAGGNQVDFVASGTIGDGSTVILNNDGTVSVVAGVDTSVGTPVLFESGEANDISATFDSAAGKVVIAYKDDNNSSYGTAIVGTVSGSSISFGTAVVFNSGRTHNTASTFDSAAGKVVIAYRDFGNANYGTAIVGTVSGTSISFGTEVVFNSTGLTYTYSALFDIVAGKVVVSYADGGNSNYGTSIVGTVSGTSISFGTAIVFESASALGLSATFDSTLNKIVIAYPDGGNSSYGTAIVGTVSGTSISFGTAVVFNSAATYYPAATFDSASGKVVIAYQDNGNSNYGTAIVGTVSGTSISFGAEVVFESANTYYLAATFDSNAGKVVIVYQDNGGSLDYGTLVVGTVSGTSISFDSPVIFESAAAMTFATTFDSTLNKVVIAYKDLGNLEYGTSVVFTNTTTNNTSFIGISDAAISDTATGSVTIKGGISTNVTGLTPNTDYYVQTDGSLSATVSTVPAGKALSATSILLKG